MGTIILIYIGFSTFSHLLTNVIIKYVKYNFIITIGKDKKLESYYKIENSNWDRSYLVKKYEYVSNCDNVVSFIFLFLLPIFYIGYRSYVQADKTFTFAKGDDDLLTKTECASSFYERNLIEFKQKESDKKELLNNVDQKIKELINCD